VFKSKWLAHPLLILSFRVRVLSSGPFLPTELFIVFPFTFRSTLDLPQTTQLLQTTTKHCVTYKVEKLK